MPLINAFKESINFKRTEPCQVKWPCLRETLQPPRMCANVQYSFLHTKPEDSSNKSHCNKWQGERRTLCVAARQKVSYVTLQVLTSKGSHF